MSKLNPSPVENQRVAAGMVRPSADRFPSLDDDVEDNGLNALAWFLDGNSGPIPPEILARLNASSRPAN